MRIKKAGFLTKIVVLALLISMATSLLDIQAQLSRAQEELTDLSRQKVVLVQENADLTDAIVNNSDPERIEEIARDKLNLVKRNDKVFITTD